MTSCNSNYLMPPENRSTDTADIVHWTADPEEASHGLAVVIEGVRYVHHLRLNQPLPADAVALLPKCIRSPIFPTSIWLTLHCPVHAGVAEASFTLLQSCRGHTGSRPSTHHAASDLHVRASHEKLRAEDKCCALFA